MDERETAKLLEGPLKVVNVGLEDFARDLERGGVEVLDLSHALAVAAERGSVYAAMHLNRAGNAAVAARLREWIGHAFGRLGAAPR